jgi:hypothetical protein
MKTYQYECDNCEDRETTREWSCGCGGRMRLVKKDRYTKHLSATYRDSCNNKGTIDSRENGLSS